MKITKSAWTIAILVAVTVALLVTPAAARTGYDNITPGDTIFIYETGLNVTNLFPAGSTQFRLVHYSGEVNASGANQIINIANASNFDVPATVSFPGEVYYAWNENGFIGINNYTVIELPYVEVDVMLAGGNDVLNDRTITRGTLVEFRLRSNTPAGFDVAGGFPPYVELRFTNPDGGPVTVFGNGTFTTVNLTASEFRTAPVDTAAVDTGIWRVQALWRNVLPFNDFYGDGVDSASRVFTIGTARPTITVNTDQVVRNNGFTATITGRGNAPFWVFVQDAALECDRYPLINPFVVGGQPGVTPIFSTDAGNIANITADNGNPAVCNGTMARVTTSAAGTRTITFSTSQMTNDRTYTLKVIEVGVPNNDDSVTIRVTKGAVTVDAEGTKIYYVGQDVQLFGENTDSDFVNLFITGPNLASNGNKLSDPTVVSVSNVLGTFDNITVQADNTWEFTWHTAEVPLDAGTYTIYAISQPFAKENLSRAEYGTVSVQLRRPFVNASLPSSRVAKGDELAITGTAEGNPSQGVQVWVLGTNLPRAPETTVVEDDGTFEFKLDQGVTSDWAAGQYFVVVQHPMYNDRLDVVYNSTSGEVSNLITGQIEFKLTGAGRLMGSDAAQALVSVLDQPNIDDTYTRLFFLLEEPFINIDAISDKAVGETFTISGTTNLAVDDTLLVTVTSSSFQPTDKTTGGEFSGVSGSTTVVRGTGVDNTWSFNVDTTGFRPDQYIVTVEGIEVSVTSTTTFFVSEVPPTTVTTQPPVTTPTVTVTTTAPATTTTVPPTTTPGFGAVIALIGLGAVAVLVLRRH